jgi:glycosyltransferase involved in cell wall biosynthesis
MRIAQVAPLYERVPPLYYGGTERIVSYLSEELIKQGHEITLFASGDSLTKGRLIAPCQRSLRLDPDCAMPLVYHVLQLDQLYQNAASFDIIHFHIDYLHFPFARRLGRPHVTTLHGRLDLPDLVPLYEAFTDVPVVSISNSQRRPLPSINWQGTVYHGIPSNLYQLRSDRGAYLAFIGRIAPEKRVDRAIEIARRANIKLKIAAKVDPIDKNYMETKIRPLLDHPLVEFIGEIEKPEFLGNALALLFPIDWVEPFGLVMIEAMACGTPTIAFRQGSVPEIIDSGLTGFVVNNVDESLAALAKLRYFDRARCRRVFEERFSVSRMAADYLKTYERVIDAKRRSRPRLVEAKEKQRPKATRSSSREAGSRVIPLRTEPESTG